MTDKIQHPATLAAQGLGWIDDVTHAVSPPLHASSTYIRDPDNQYRSGRDYIRADNPAALQTYLAHGFVVIGTAKRQARIDGQYIDEILIEKWLQ